jgi:hypothetical protein
MKTVKIEGENVDRPISQAFARVLMIIVCVSPSLVCFGLAGWCMIHGIQEGGGWLLFVGILCMGVPEVVVKLLDRISDEG